MLTNIKAKKFWKSKESDIVIHKDKMNIIESCLDRHAQNQPNKLALVLEGEKNKIIKFTYKQLQQEANKFANLLQSLKIPQSSRVFIFLPKNPEIYISFLGTIKHGSISIPLFEAFQTEGLTLRLNRGDATVLVTNKELSKRIPKDIKKKVPTLKQIIIIDEKKYKNQIKKQSTEFKTVLKKRKDTAIMIFTSSTAGTPVAGIEIPHQALIQQHYTGKLVLELTPEDNYWCTAHPGWVTGAVYGIISPLSIGSTIYNYTPHFDAKKWISFIKKNKISVLYSAPTAFRLLKPTLKKSDLKNIKNISSVGEALTPATFNHFKKLGIQITDTFWQTETGAIVIASYKGIKKKAGSMGKPIPGIILKIKKGAIALKPNFPSLMTGIYKHDKMYKSYFKAGLFRTNDMVKSDKEGYIFFQHRKDDIIKTAGERVSPIELESILMTHKAVKEVGIIGIPDKIKGSIIKAFVVLNKGFKPSEALGKELGQYVKKNYAGHAYPKVVEFRESLPKTNSGKIIRMKLREEHK